MGKKKTVKRKLEVVFDPDKRKEFLTGFPKRKNERRKRAREELERNLKEERKRIREEVKNGMKNLKKSYEPLRELTEEDRKDDDEIRQENEYEDDDVKVKIVELTTADLAKSRNLLGENKNESSDEAEADGAKKTDDSDEEARNVNCIPGMDFDVTTKMQKRKHKDDDDSDGDEDENTQPTQAKKPKFNKLKNLDLKSKKDLDRFTSKKMRNKLKQSKVFQLKERFQKRANQKQAKRERNNTLKSLPKNQRKKKKLEPSNNRYRKGRMVNKKQSRR